MIITLLLTGIDQFLCYFSSFFPGYDPTDSVFLKLPWGIDDLMVKMVSYFNGAMQTLPYLHTVMVVFIYGLGFELGMLVLKLFLGSRTPGHIN